MHIPSNIYHNFLQSHLDKHFILNICLIDTLEACGSYKAIYTSE